MQTSFIPKKPIAQDNSGDGSSVSLLTLLAIIIFIVSIGLGAGVWVWKGQLVKQIETDKQNLFKAKNAYEPNTVESLIRLDDRIEVSKNLLGQHIAVSPVFRLLELNTLRNVRFKNMKFSYGDGKIIKLEMAGVSRNFQTIAKQSDVFGGLKFLTQPVVSDLSLAQDGSVTFNFTAGINIDLLSYPNSKNIGSTAETNASTNVTN